MNQRRDNRRMLALLAAVALAQFDAPRLETLTPQELRAEIDVLEAGRPALYAPISSLVLGVVMEVVAAIVFYATGEVDAPRVMSCIGFASLIGGGISLGTTLWSRSQIGQMIEERERRLK